MSVREQSFLSKALGGGRLALHLRVALAAVAMRCSGAVRDWSNVSLSASTKCNEWRELQRLGPGEPPTPEDKIQGIEFCKHLTSWGHYKSLDLQKEVYFSCIHVGRGGAMKVEAHILSQGISLSYISRKRADECINDGEFTVELYPMETDWASKTMTLTGTTGNGGHVFFEMHLQNQVVEFVSSTHVDREYNDEEFDDHPSENPENKERCPKVQSSLRTNDGKEHPCIDEVRNIVGNTCHTLVSYGFSADDGKELGARCSTEAEEGTDPLLAQITFHDDMFGLGHDSEGFLYEYLYFSEPKNLRFDVRSKYSVQGYKCYKIKLPQMAEEEQAEAAQMLSMKLTSETWSVSGHQLTYPVEYTTPVDVSTWLAKAAKGRWKAIGTGNSDGE